MFDVVMQQTLLLQLNGMQGHDVSLLEGMATLMESQIPWLKYATCRHATSLCIA
jgi:hypothetical protein